MVKAITKPARMILFGIEIRRVPKPSKVPKVEPFSDESLALARRLRDAVPPDDEELRRAKPIQEAGLEMICTHCGWITSRLYFTPGWEGAVCRECRHAINPASKFYPDILEL